MMGETQTTPWHRVWPGLVLVLALSGCTTVTTPGPGDDPDYAAVKPKPKEATGSPSSGSIYNASASQARTSRLNLFEDDRARRVGDTLTVVLDEQTSAEKEATTETERDASSEFEVSTPVPTPLGETASESAESSSDFEGDSEAEQSNSIEGSVTVTVAKVLPTGSMVVQGEKWLTLNQGQEFVRVRGIVRREDIQPDNTVASTKLANARIAYGGRGSLADNNRPGWFTRLMQSPVWPF